MGYTTEFRGYFKFDKPLDENLKNYLLNFSETRRMDRDNEIIMREFPDWESMCFNGNLGNDGEYFVNVDGDFGQSRDDSIMNYNRPPISQPGFWCQWVPNEAGTKLVWDGGEKFYNYIEWLKYLIKHFIAPSGYTLNGMVTWQGESSKDQGTIEVYNNEIFVND